MPPAPSVPSENAVMSEAALGSADRPLWVAVIGSGPSGFYAIDALFKAEGLHVHCDLFDRLPTPFGLVRGGVAPDHQKIKSVIAAYERTAAHENFRFFGHVALGTDVSVDELSSRYDCLIYAFGNESDRKMGVEGEELAGIHSATAFVGWYNGHPDFRNESFDLAAAKRVAVVGNGNVAMDVTRILAKHPDALKETDIAGAALEALRSSSVEEILLLGRRGPAQAAFSPKEIQEVCAVEACDTVVAPDEVAIDEVSRAWLEKDAPASAKKNLQILIDQSAAGPGSHARKVQCRFLVSPVSFAGEGGRVTSVRLEHGELEADKHGTPRACGTGRFTDEPVDLVFKAIGYRGVPIAGVPFDESWGIVPNVGGRVVTERGSDVPIPGQYVVGWAKRGPTGLIGTNNADSKATVASLLEDVANRQAPPLPAGHERRITTLLADREVDVVSYADWKRLDAHELARGAELGKVREKLTSVDAMMDVVRELRVKA